MATERASGLPGASASPSNSTSRAAVSVSGAGRRFYWATGGSGTRTSLRGCAASRRRLLGRRRSPSCRSRLAPTTARFRRAPRPTRQRRCESRGSCRSSRALLHASTASPENCRPGRSSPGYAVPDRRACLAPARRAGAAGGDFRPRSQLGQGVQRSHVDLDGRGGIEAATHVVGAGTGEHPCAAADRRRAPAAMA